MSKAAIDLLRADAEESGPPKTASKKAIELLRSDDPKPVSATRKPVAGMRGTQGQTADLGRAIGRGETALQTVSGLAGKVVGGVAGVGSLLMGQGADTAAEQAKWYEQALTYQPRSAEAEESSAALGDAMGSPWNPLAWPGAVGEFGADKAEEAGWSPLAVTAMRMAPEALTALAGAPGTPSLSRVGQTVASDARTVGRVLGDAEEAVPGGPLNPFERESLGAAAAVPSQLQTASAGLQAAVRAEARAGGVDRAALDRHLEADSLPIPMRLTKGQATQDPVQISEELNKRAKGDAELVRVFNKQNEQLIDNLDEIRREASPNVVGNDHIQNGQQLIDSYKAYDEAVRTDIAAKYQALRDANGGEFPVDGPAFVAEADKALKRNMKGRYVPAQVAADLEAIRTGEVAMNFEQFENLRTNLAAEGRKAERSGDGNAAAAVNLVREALESLPLTGEAAALKPIADAARSAAKARFDRLRADPAYKAVADDAVEMGEPSALADNFIQNYVVKGKAANIDRMRETLASDPVASEVLAAGALNYLKSKSGVNLYTNEGNFTQRGFNAALSEITPKLERLVGPQRAEQIQTLGNVARYSMSRPKGSYVNESNTFVAAAKEKALSAAEMAINTTVFPGAGLGTRGRDVLARRAEKQFVKEATKPGAGLKLKELLKAEEEP